MAPAPQTTDAAVSFRGKIPEIESAKTELLVFEGNLGKLTALYSVRPKGVRDEDIESADKTVCKAHRALKKAQQTLESASASPCVRLTWNLIYQKKYKREADEVQRIGIEVELQINKMEQASENARNRLVLEPIRREREEAREALPKVYPDLEILNEATENGADGLANEIPNPSMGSDADTPASECKRSKRGSIVATTLDC